MPKNKLQRIIQFRFLSDYQFLENTNITVIDDAAKAD